MTPNSYKEKFLREDLMFKKHVKESFSLAFFKLILRDIIQPAILQNEEPDRTRTALQYLIEILVILNDRTITRLVYCFLFDKMDLLKAKNNEVAGGDTIEYQEQ
jgi:hypothetical protein